MHEVIRHELALALAHYIYTRGQEGWPDLCAKLDAYIDARIAEKVPQAVPCPDVTPEQATKYKQAVADFDRMMSNVEPAPPTAREVHEAWRKWYGKGYTSVRPLGPEFSTREAPPSFPELET